jgi:hypothetical protein
MARFFTKFQSRDHSLPFRMLVLAGIWIHFGVQGLATMARLGLRRLGAR